MEANLSVQPTVDGRVLSKLWLGETILHIRTLLERFSDPPTEIYHLGITNTPQVPATTQRPAHGFSPGD